MPSPMVASLRNAFFSPIFNLPLSFWWTVISGLSPSQLGDGDQSLVRHRHHPVAQRLAECLCLDFILVPGSRLDAGGVAHHRRSEEIGVQVARPAVHRVAEMEVFEIGD